MNKKWVWIVLPVAGVVACSLFWKRGGSQSRQPAYRAVAVIRGNIESSILTTGEVQPQNRVEIKSPIGGRVEEISVKEGEEVRKGDILAWMSSTERTALLDAARTKGPKELAHWTELYKPAPLAAPISGIVIDRKVEPGQTVTTSDAVLVLSDRLIVKAQVDETDVGMVKVGQKARVELDAYPKQFIASTVDHIAYEAQTVNNVTIYYVDVLPGEVPPFMRSGMTANVTFITATRQQALLVPAEAVRQREGKWIVQQPSKKKNGPNILEVEPGISSGKQIEILSGLAEGDSVLVPETLLMTQSHPATGATNPFSPFGQRRGGSGR